MQDVYIYIMHRTQIYASNEQRTALARLAQGRGVTASAVIREAIDAYLVAQLSPEERLARLRALGDRTRARVRAPASPGSRETVESLREADASRLDFRG